MKKACARARPSWLCSRSIGPPPREEEAAEAASSEANTVRGCAVPPPGECPDASTCRDPRGCPAPAAALAEADDEADDEKEDEDDEEDESAKASDEPAAWRCAIMKARSPQTCSTMRRSPKPGLSEASSCATGGRGGSCEGTGPNEDRGTSRRELHGTYWPFSK